MKSFFSRVVSRWKTKRLPRADLDCSDLIQACPGAPSVALLRQIVRQRRFGAAMQEERSEKGEGDPVSAKALQEEMSIRSSVFDLQYRCGAGGRCVQHGSCSGASAGGEALGGGPKIAATKGTGGCRFPRCFVMRPITKGAEVLSARLAYEVDNAPTPQLRAIVELARAESLPAAVAAIQEHVDTIIRLAAGGRPLHSAFQQDQVNGGVEGCELSPGAVKYGSESEANGVHPLIENSELREEVISLYLWRAALLVNMREDERAVCSLLNLATILCSQGRFCSNASDKGHGSQSVHQLYQGRLRLYTSAAAWAALNDMEVVYYRSVLKQYEPFPLAETFAHNRSLLLKRVLAACTSTGGGSNCNDEAAAYIVECVTHVVFAKEITAAVSRAQSAQQYGDFTEDPMKSLCIPLALRYYRFHVHEAFWEHFFNLLCMPPIPSPTTGEEKANDMAERLGLTPSHVLDAIGRSLLLHHLLMLHEARSQEIASGTVAETVRRLHTKTKACETTSSSGDDARGVSSVSDPDGNPQIVVHPSQYKPILTERERLIAVTRLRELLAVARGYESSLTPVEREETNTHDNKGSNSAQAAASDVKSVGSAPL
ncbi:hypothetical protein ERJ75_000421600 [Trypanosoma vivax]|uniref:Uncharacterized protein n=1 Tax=Trypanosoma vivax (strain Y486) TaxID=1055687 RepID=G0TV39_TRYVY|nr:hypothetical protein TRVL_04855 [Trypanosoma vivax]KAH8616967.1 hypothetical protein ERJ75_000421600 [Trypanosoma vivax]CCC47804.1 conserved hypothetical protein [Trypanosoma vivax Y486]